MSKGEKIRHELLRSKNTWELSRACKSSKLLLFSRSVVSDSFVTPWAVVPPGFSVHGISQARILEWVVIPFSRASSRHRDRTRVSCIGQWILYCWATQDARAGIKCLFNTSMRHLPLPSLPSVRILTLLWRRNGTEQHRKAGDSESWNSPLRRIGLAIMSLSWGTQGSCVNSWRKEEGRPVWGGLCLFICSNSYTSRGNWEKYAGVVKLI